MRKGNLRTRLFWSHMIVMILGVSTLLIVSKVYTPRLFINHLETLQEKGLSKGTLRRQIMEGFESAWSWGALATLAIGGATAMGLSYWASQRIMQPLIQLEQTTRRFAAGHLDERVPVSDVPELRRLANSFNRMAQELEEVEQRRRDLVGDLTHELRTPLTVVEGYLEGLADGTIPASADIYQRLTRETARLRRLVNDLQELSQAEAGYLPIAAQPCHLQPLLTALVQNFADQVLANQPSLYLVYPDSLPWVIADPERVEQILVNLVGNALRYTPQGSITLRAVAESDRVWIAVEDTGQGIAPEDLPHVFERFWRADRSRDRHSGGTGIGLAICRRLVELQGGTISATSQLGQGSTFRFSLPIARSR